MPFAPPLSDRGFEHRLSAIQGTLSGWGEVLPWEDERRASSRGLRVRVALPGYDLPLQATMVFVERYRRAGARWDLVRYQYDYHFEPRPSGRKAYHWHDGSFHIHCHDPQRPGVEHYRGFAVDLLEGAREFAEIYSRGEASCLGLHPLLYGKRQPAGSPS